MLQDDAPGALSLCPNVLCFHTLILIIIAICPFALGYFHEPLLFCFLKTFSGPVSCHKSCNKTSLSNKSLRAASETALSLYSTRGIIGLYLKISSHIALSLVPFPQTDK